MERAKIYFETYGCSYNKADTRIMEEIVSRRHEVVEDIDRAEVIVLNTCYVKTPTEHRIVNRIKELKAKFPNKKMVIAGCMPMIDKEKALEANPNASLLGPQNLEKVSDIIDETLRGAQPILLEYRRVDKSTLPKLWRKNEVIRIVQICEGCADICTYCCTRIARGPIFSFNPENIVEEVKRGVQEGAKEFWLTAQDTSAYGIERGDSLAELISKVVEVDGEFYVRVGMMNPNHTLKMVDALIDAYKSPKVFKFLHLPVQSGSNRILKMMRRRYRVEEALEVVNRFRKTYPKITFATDIIVGYPDETDDDFNETIKFIEETNPDIVNLSKFGKRPKTPLTFSKNYDVHEVKERTRKAHEIIAKSQLQGYNRWLGWRGNVLIDEHIGGDSVGRNECYKNIVLKERIPLGTSVEVKVIGASKHFLLGERVKT